MRSLLAQLADPRSVAHGLVSTAAVGALTMVDPRRLTPGTRQAHRMAISGTTVWMTWASLGEEPVLGHRPAVRTGLTLGSAATVAAAYEKGARLDARLHGRLRRAGVTRPRIVLAALGAVAALGSWWLGRRDNSDSPDAWGLADDDAETVPVPDDIRALVQWLLAGTDAYGSAELRVQLGAAEAVVFEGPDLDGFWPGIGFRVPQHVPMVVPGDANFPVVGRFRALEGRTFDVYLSVQGGRLSSLSVGEGRDWSEDDHVAWMDSGRGVHELSGWPTPDVLERLVETPEGLRPA